MSDSYLIMSMKEMLFYVMMAVSFISVPMLIVGIFFSVIQAATQINEMTITFIPKILVMFALLLFLSPWLIEHLISFTRHLLLNMPANMR